MSVEHGAMIRQLAAIHVGLLVFSDVVSVREPGVVELVAPSCTLPDQQSSAVIIAALGSALSPRPHQCGTVGRRRQAPSPTKPESPISPGLLSSAGAHWKSLEILLKDIFLLPVSPLDALPLIVGVIISICQLKVPLSFTVCVSCKCVNFDEVFTPVNVQIADVVLCIVADHNVPTFSVPNDTIFFIEKDSIRVH